MMRLIRSGLRPRRRKQPGQALILMYHSISRGRRDPWDLCVAPELFVEQAQLLRDRYRVLSLADLRCALSRNEPFTHTVVLTFDDGDRDNLEVAKPILEEHGLPATIFVATGYVGSGRDFWWDELEAFCASAGIASRELWEELTGSGHDERFARLDALWDSINLPRPEPSLPLSADELARLAGELICLGAHTVTHPHLSLLPLPAQRHEIEASKAYLTEVAGRPVRDFSYPHGDFSQQTLALVESAGFESACTTRSMPVTSTTSLFELPRIQVGSWDAESLERELERRLG
jgi:peptidoglycan/xylan/chitin deacetylase (PgdA/CDA1 family)